LVQLYFHTVEVRLILISILLINSVFYNSGFGTTQQNEKC
jgi:hypothetical protein